MESGNKKGMSYAGKGWAVLFAIFLTLSLFLSLTAVTLENTVFSASFSKNLLEEQKVYDQLPQMITSSITQNILNSNQAGKNPNLISLFPQEQLDQFITAILPKDYLKNQTDLIIDSVYAFVNLKSKTLFLQIDLVPVKEALAGQIGKDAISKLINSFPVCTQEQLNSIIGSVLQQKASIQITLPMCKPPEPFLSLLMPLVLNSTKSLSDMIPANMDISNSSIGKSVADVTNSKAYMIYALVRKIFVLAPWISLFIVLILILLCLRSLKAMSFSIGIPLFIAGIVGVIFALFMRMGGGVFLNTFQISGAISAFSPIITLVLKVFVIQATLIGLYIFGASLLAGLLLMVLGGKVKS